MSMLRRLALLSCAALAACLAPAPRIVVSTPFGEVRANSSEKASEVAALLAELSPKVRSLLPGSQDRPIDVWVQERLAVYRFQERPESVRGFTLLADEFRARRIHLQEDGQSSWYLAHELVHALVDESWRPLPGILEEGLGDVVAQQVSMGGVETRAQARFIGAHRLLNSCALVGGLRIDLAWSVPANGVDPRQWRRERGNAWVELEDSVTREEMLELLSTSRTDLHRRYPEIPETFYGIAWLLTSRIAERRGLEGLHELCLRATREGHRSVPPAWILEAAEIDLDTLSPTFLAQCFGKDELIAACNLRPDLFSKVALTAMKGCCVEPPSRRQLRRIRPAWVLADGTEVLMGPIWPLFGMILESWHEEEPSSTP